MTKQCPQCKRMLELNDCNFRLSCDGYWRSKCRDCENQRKRRRYISGRPSRVKKSNPYKEARKQRLQVLLAEYDEIFKILQELGISVNAPSVYVDKVLADTTISNKISA